MGAKRQRRQATVTLDVIPALRTAGAILMARREALGLSRTEVAAMIGVAPSSIQFVEEATYAVRHRASIGLINLLGWVAVLGLTMADIFPAVRAPAVQWFVGLCPQAQETFAWWGQAWSQVGASVPPPPFAPLCGSHAKK